jgi:hypothetical protein
MEIRIFRVVQKMKEKVKRKRKLIRKIRKRLIKIKIIKIMKK